MTNIEQISSKLYSQNHYMQEEAIDEISVLFQSINQNKQIPDQPVQTPDRFGQQFIRTGGNQTGLNNVLKDDHLLDSLILKVADVFGNSTNQLRALIVTQIFEKCSSQIEKCLSNKEVFLKRIEHNLMSNDIQARILALKILSHLPSLLITRLHAQHLILHILTTSQDKVERQIATKTIQAVSNGSDLFAKSIMHQIRVRFENDYFDEKTCVILIAAMENVPGDAISTLALFETLTSMYDYSKSDQLRQAILQAMLRKTLRAPILLEKVLDFLVEIWCFEGIQVLSRKFKISEARINQVFEKLQQSKNSLLDDIVQHNGTQAFMLLANQQIIFQNNVNVDHLQTCKISLQKLEFQCKLNLERIFPTYYLTFLSKNFETIQIDDKDYKIDFNLLIRVYNKSQELQIKKRTSLPKIKGFESELGRILFNQNPTTDKQSDFFSIFTSPEINQESLSGNVHYYRCLFYLIQSEYFNTVELKETIKLVIHQLLNRLDENQEARHCFFNIIHIVKEQKLLKNTELFQIYTQQIHKIPLKWVIKNFEKIQDLHQLTQNCVNINSFENLSIRLVAQLTFIQHLQTTTTIESMNKLQEIQENLVDLQNNFVQMYENFQTRQEIEEETPQDHDHIIGQPVLDSYKFTIFYKLLDLFLLLIRIIMRSFYERDQNQSQMLQQMIKSYKVMVLQIKRDFGLDQNQIDPEMCISLLDNPQNIGHLKLPQILFLRNQMKPHFVTIKLSSSASQTFYNLTTQSGILRKLIVIQNAKILILRANFGFSNRLFTNSKQQSLLIQMQTHLLQYHGDEFQIQQSEVVWQDQQKFHPNVSKSSKESDKILPEQIYALPLPSIGNFLFRITATIQVQERDGKSRNIGIETRKFLTIINKN